MGGRSSTRGGLNLYKLEILPRYARRALKLKHRNIRGRESDSFGDDDISLCEEAVAYAVWVSLKLLSIHVVGMLLPLNSSCSNLSFLMSRFQLL
ncbi:unnamed protein product [Brassica napus]|uniref:(rape) hypothetical protein n=1 Tax=Brassica napus TaxID=3708 RepID=A0A816IKI7_BRANA|nr:unnamed protein product [Brassica napus]